MGFVFPGHTLHALFVSLFKCSVDVDGCSPEVSVASVIVYNTSAASFNLKIGGNPDVGEEEDDTDDDDDNVDVEV